MCESGRRKLVPLRGRAALRRMAKRNLRTQARSSAAAGRARRGGARAGSRQAAALQSLRQLGGSGRRRRAPAVYEASPGAPREEPGGTRGASGLPGGSRTRVGTSPGPRDGRVWSPVGRSRETLNLLLMNLFQKVRDLQLEAVRVPAREGARCRRLKGGGLGNGRAKEGGGLCVFKNKP